MTLTEYEAAVATMPGWQRFTAAGPAAALRQQLALGEPFAASRDRIVQTEAQHRALVASEQAATFAALTGV